MPRTSIVPLVGSSSVESIFIVVVFPAPFGPSRPKISPVSTRRSISSTARKRVRRSGSRRSRCHSVYRPFSNSLTSPVATTAGVTRPAQSLGWAERHAQGWWSRSSRHARLGSLTGAPPPDRSSLASFNKDLHPVFVVGDVDELPGVVDRAQELVEIDPELRKVAPDQPAGRELHLSHPRDREGDRDVDLLLAVLGDADAQDPATRPGRHRRLGWSWRRWWCARGARSLVDVAERPQQPERLLDVDLAVGEQLQDLLAFVARHVSALGGLNRARQRRHRRRARHARVARAPSAPLRETTYPSAGSARRRWWTLLQAPPLRVARRPEPSRACRARSGRR